MLPPLIDNRAAQAAVLKEQEGFRGIMKNDMLKPRSKAEQIGFWVIVAAAGVLGLVLLGAVLGPALRALGVALVITAFVALLTGLNSQAMADRANALLGRKIFPIVKADEAAVRRLVRVNSALTFVFTFAFTILSQVFGAIFAALIIVGAVALALGVLPRLRRPSSRVISTTYSSDRTPTDRVA